jgi:hypothetical protein
MMDFKATCVREMLTTTVIILIAIQRAGIFFLLYELKGFYMVTVDIYSNYIKAFNIQQLMFSLTLENRLNVFLKGVEIYS